MVGAVSALVDLVVSWRRDGDWEAAVETSDGSYFPSANHLVQCSIHIGFERTTFTEWQLVVSGKGEDVSSIEERRTVIGTAVIRILPVSTLRGDAASSVVAAG